jgi:hypothetical protein
MSNAIDLTGQHFHLLTALERAGSAPNNGGARWRCLCDCGTETFARASDLRSGAHRSCGCLRERKLLEARKSPKTRRSSNDKLRAEMRRNLQAAGVPVSAFDLARRRWA